MHKLISMANNWIETTDSEGNKISINPQIVCVLEHSFDVDEHLEYLYRMNTKKALKSA